MQSSRSEVLPDATSHFEHGATHQMRHWAEIERDPLDLSDTTLPNFLSCKIWGFRN
jgi:hypothetical protein